MAAVAHVGTVGYNEMERADQVRDESSDSVRTPESPGRTSTSWMSPCSRAITMGPPHSTASRFQKRRTANMYRGGNTYGSKRPRANVHDVAPRMDLIFNVWRQDAIMTRPVKCDAASDSIEVGVLRRPPNAK